MKRTTYYCDRCGKEIRDFPKNPQIAVAELIYDGYAPEMDKSKDLCRDCYKSFEEWWRAGKRDE